MPILQQHLTISKPEVSEQTWELGNRVGLDIFPLVLWGHHDGSHAIRFKDLIRAVKLTHKRRSVAMEVIRLAIWWLRVSDFIPASYEFAVTE